MDASQYAEMIAKIAEAYEAGKISKEDADKAVLGLTSAIQS